MQTHSVYRHSAVRMLYPIVFFRWSLMFPPLRKPTQTNEIDFDEPWILPENSFLPIGALRVLQQWHQTGALYANKNMRYFEGSSWEHVLPSLVPGCT